MPILSPRLNRWTEPENLSGLLIFAQALQEKLFDYTIDSYKARALNIHTSIYEIAAVSDLVQENKLDSGTLIPLVDELESQISNDLILTKREIDIFNVYLERLKSSRTKIASFIETVDAMLIELNGFYWKRIQEKISSEVRKDHNSKLLIHLADIFVTECELQGYHRSYVFNVSKKYFWRKKISSHDSIDEFLNIFNGTKKSYSFYLKANSCFKELSDLAGKFNIIVLENTPEINVTHAHIAEFLIHNSEYPHYLKIDNVTATNPVSARVRVERQLEAVASVYSFFVHQHSPRWQPVALCVSEEGEFEGVLKPQLQPVRKCIHASVESKKKDIEVVVELLSGAHFVRDDTHIFLKALDYHRAAISAESPENQLVDLWAALEGFLPSPDKDTSRISHYASVLMPCLTLSYAEKLFRYLAESLSEQHNNVVNFINDSISGRDFFDRTASLIVSAEYSDERSALFAMLTNNPLLRYRCFQLNEMFHDSSKVARTVLEHKRRVEWHIQRIYITRNQIVHNASSFPYLHTLVENLHSYIDLMINAVATVGVKSQNKTSASGALKLLSVLEQSYIRSLQKTNIACRKENFRSIVFGESNPLNPYHQGFTLGQDA